MEKTGNAFLIRASHIYKNKLKEGKNDIIENKNDIKEILKENDNNLNEINIEKNR